VTQQDQRGTEIWREADFARDWASNDGLADILEFPRRIAAAVVADDNTAPECVVDIGSGPGAFLAVFLDRFPSARGIWTDVSDAMLDLAKVNLARFNDRVEYRILDMTDLSGGALSGGAIPAGVNVITTSRAAHHLGRDGLFAFYAQAAALLAPGGWLVNLDHTGPADIWDTRLRAVRKQFVPPASARAAHHHNYPLTSAADHLDGFAAAGISDVEIVWRAFFTCLFMGRVSS
jgi:SAM-dependent methyltransferase